MKTFSALFCLLVLHGSAYGACTFNATIISRSSTGTLLTANPARNTCISLTDIAVFDIYNRYNTNAPSRISTNVQIRYSSGPKAIRFDGAVRSPGSAVLVTTYIHDTKSIQFEQGGYGTYVFTVSVGRGPSAPEIKAEIVVPFLTPEVSINRSNILRFSAVGSPIGGSFQHTSTSFISVKYDNNGTSQTNPNNAIMSVSKNPKSSATPGELARVTTSYTSPDKRVASKSFRVAIFGLSCYITAKQSDYGSAPSGCSNITIGGVQYSGFTSNPTGLPSGRYCNGFLAMLRLNGSAYLDNGKLAKYDSANKYYVPSSQILLGGDSKPISAGRNVARDRNIIPRGDISVDIEGIGSGLVANDVGNAIVGYRLDYYAGVGKAACLSHPTFSNPMAVGACNPGNDKCPRNTAVQ